MQGLPYDVVYVYGCVASITRIRLANRQATEGVEIQALLLAAALCQSCGSIDAKRVFKARSVLQTRQARYT